MELLYPMKNIIDKTPDVINRAIVIGKELTNAVIANEKFQNCEVYNYF